MNINNNFLAIVALIKALCNAVDSTKTSKDSIVMGGGESQI